MKTSNIGLALSVALLLGTTDAKAADDMQDLYVTQAGCRVYADGRDLDSTQDGVQTFEVWAHLSSDSNQYTPDKNTRVYIYTTDSVAAREQCEKLYHVYKSGKKATFSLKKHFYDNSTDPTNVGGWHNVKIITTFTTGKLTENFSARLFNETGSGEPKPIK